MGKIGKSVREELGLIKPDSGSNTEKTVSAKANEVGDTIMSFGIKVSQSSEGSKQYECVMLKLEGGKVVSEEVLSPTPRGRKALVLEDWRRQAGKFILSRHDW